MPLVEVRRGVRCQQASLCWMLPLEWRCAQVNVTNSPLRMRDSLENAQYVGALGGPCENFDPPFSYWCSAHPVC
jgi:hypothetical protein